MGVATVTQNTRTYASYELKKMKRNRQWDWMTRGKTESVSIRCFFIGQFVFNHVLVFFVFVFCFFLHHNVVYSKSPVYNNLNGPGVNIKGPCFT